jgi:phosphoglycolate phosphatase
LIKALLVDLDGTLVSTLAGHTEAWREVLCRHAGGFPALAEPWVLRSFVRTMSSGGHSGLLMEGALKRAGVSRPDAERLVAEKRALYLELAERMTEAVPGMCDAIAALKSDGYALAIQTTTRRPVAEKLLRLIYGPGFTDQFMAIVGGDAVARLKPAPDTLIMAAKLVGCLPDECLVIGDSRTDLQAAISAGMRMVALHAGRPAPRWVRRTAGSTGDAAALPSLVAFLSAVGAAGVGAGTTAGTGAGTAAGARTGAGVGTAAGAGPGTGAWIDVKLPGMARTKNRGFSATYLPAVPAGTPGPLDQPGPRWRVYVKSYAEEPRIRSHAEMHAMLAFRRAQAPAEGGERGGQDRRARRASTARSPEPLAVIGERLVMRHETAVKAARSLGTRLATAPAETLPMLDRYVRRTLAALERSPWPPGAPRHPLFDEKFERYAVGRVLELADLWEWPAGLRSRHAGAVEIARRGAAEAADPRHRQRGSPQRVSPQLMHGDLKLDNIIVTSSRLWVIDFEHARGCAGADALFDLATVAVDTMIRGALVPAQYRAPIATVVGGWLSGADVRSFGPCFLLACAIQGGTLRPGRAAYPPAPPQGPSYQAIYRSLMETAFDVVEGRCRPEDAPKGFWGIASSNSLH